jgi:predicted AAA+ superfamily ATPase
MTLKAWRQVVTPHADIRSGKFDASVFAADLGEVLAGRGAVDYRDAATFFAKTYLTEGISRLLVEIMQRLSGTGKADPVIQMQTPFGGGKTHTLLTMYHTVKQPNLAAKEPQVKALMDAAKLKVIPAAQVACLVGTALNPASDRTLWGEMAFQLGGDKLFQLVARNDQSKTAPGSTLIGEVLQAAGPCLILMDELLVYLLNAGSIHIGESTLRGTTLTFLQQLTIAVSNCPHACMIATLTSQLSEFLDVDEKAERAYQSLEMVLGRTEKVRQAVEGAEIYEVIRRRLFENVGDKDQHRATAEAYWTMYRKLGEDVPTVCREPSYRDALIAAYPFHPELVSVLYERWGTIPTFQRTRGVLRLLADVISEQYQAKVNEPVIQSSSINLGSAAVRSELVKHTGHGNVYHSVVESDIAGKTAKAPEIDRQLGSEYSKENVAEKCARAVFMYSFSGSQQRGATLPQIRLSALNPEMAPPFISDALERMTKRLWFLYQDSGLYRFDSNPNLNRILVDREEMIRSDPDKVKDFAKNTLNDLIGDAAFRVYRYPQPGDDSHVGDEPRLSLVVLDLQHGAKEDALPQETEELVTRILKQHGKGFRKHANMLIFLAPDQERSSEVIEAARRLLALRNIDEDKTTKRQLSDIQLKDLADRLREAEARLPAALATVYRFLLIPADKKTVRCIDMSISAFSGKTTLSSKVMEKLVDEGQVLEKLDPAIMIGPKFGLWPVDQEMLNVRALANYFTQLTHLPRLHGAQVLAETIAKGVQRNLFAYALGDADKKKFDTILFDKTVTGDQCEVTESAWLLRPELAKGLMPKKEVVITSDGAEAGTEVAVETGDGSVGSGGGGGSGGGTVVKIVKGERRVNRVRITMKVPWENWNDIYNEVIDPLAQEGADLLCDLNIVAQSDGGIKENTIELVIRESLSQRGIKADIQKG